MTYYLPDGYGSIYFTTPFAIKPRLVNGVQKFYTAEPPYPFELWEIVCGNNCPYNASIMEGWEISQINGENVPTFIKSFSRRGGTFYDDGVRANAFITSIWGQTSLYATNMPEATFTVSLINPSNNDFANMTLPFGFGGPGGFSQAGMMAANRRSSTKRGEPLYAEQLLLDSLQQEAVLLRKKSDSESVERASAVEAAIQELTSNLARIEADSVLTHAILKRDGSKALLDESLPFIPTPIQRMEDVFRLQSVLFPRKEKSAAKIEAENKEFEAYVARETKYRMENSVQKKKAATAATEIPIIAGSASKWSMYSLYPSTPENAFEALNAYYGSYDGTTVLRLRSFTYSTSDTTWVTSVTNAVTQRSTRGLNDNLIIDVTNNGGGSVCLNFDTLGYLINAWTNFELTPADRIYSPYDIRISPISDLLYQNGNLTGAYDNVTGADISSTFYDNPVTRTIGGRTSQYTRPFLWVPCGNTNVSFDLAPYHFDKIIVVTDGRCASSCSYFIHQLRENNKVRVVSYGGLYNEPLATSSVAGGHVVEWEYLRTLLPQLPANPLTTYISFNFRENFHPSKYPSVPRQFERLEADWYLPFWDSFWRFYNADNYNSTARYTLYESILPLFNDMPAGLPRAPLVVPTAPETDPASPISPAAPVPVPTSPISPEAPATPGSPSTTPEAPSADPDSPSVVPQTQPSLQVPTPEPISAAYISAHCSIALLMTALLIAFVAL